MSEVLHDFTGMPGVAGKLSGPWKHSPSGFLTALRKHRIVSTAGDYGSVTAYRDDAGVLRGEFQRFRQTLDERTFPTQSALRRWLVETMPKMHERPE